LPLGTDESLNAKKTERFVRMAKKLPTDFGEPEKKEAVFGFEGLSSALISVD